MDRRVRWTGEDSTNLLGLLLHQEEGALAGFVDVYDAPADWARVFDLAPHVPNDEPRHARFIAEDIKEGTHLVVGGPLSEDQGVSRQRCLSQKAVRMFPGGRRSYSDG